MVGFDPKSPVPKPAEGADVVAGVAVLPRVPKLSPTEGLLVYKKHKIKSTRASISLRKIKINSSRLSIHLTYSIYCQTTKGTIFNQPNSNIFLFSLKISHIQKISDPK